MRPATGKIGTLPRPPLASLLGALAGLFTETNRGAAYREEQEFRRRRNRRRKHRPWRPRNRKKKVAPIVEKRPGTIDIHGICHDWYRPIALKPAGPCFTKGAWR